MKQLVLLTTAALLMLSSATAQDWAKARLEKSPRHGEWVKVKHDNRDTARHLVKAKADPNTAEVDGTTVLHWVVRADDEETAITPAAANSALDTFIFPPGLVFVTGL